MNAPEPQGRENFPSPARISESCRVLIVDDDSLFRWAMAETLRPAGCEIVEARDGQGALLEIASSAAPFDVVLLDYWLPDFDHLSLLSAIRRQAPDTAIVLMSARATPEIAEEALRLGACRVIHKPLEMGQALAIVQQACPGRRH